MQLIFTCMAPSSVQSEPTSVMLCWSRYNFGLSRESDPSGYTNKHMKNSLSGTPSSTVRSRSTEQTTMISSGKHQYRLWDMSCSIYWLLVNRSLVKAKRWFSSLKRSILGKNWKKTQRFKLKSKGSQTKTARLSVHVHTEVPFTSFLQSYDFS